MALATAAATTEGTAGWGAGTLTRATRRRSPSTCSKTNARTVDVSKSTTSADGPSVDTRGSIAPAYAPPPRFRPSRDGGAAPIQRPGHSRAASENPDYWLVDCRPSPG